MRNNRFTHYAVVVPQKHARKHTPTHPHTHRHTYLPDVGAASQVSSALKLEQLEAPPSAPYFLFLSGVWDFPTLVTQAAFWAGPRQRNQIKKLKMRKVTFDLLNQSVRLRVFLRRRSEAR